jgi:hypothetical protein
MPHAEQRARPRVVGIERERLIEQRLALLGIAADMGADRILELGELAERDRELQVGIDLIRIEGEGVPGVGLGLLEQRLLGRIGAEVRGLNQGRLGGARDAAGSPATAEAGGPIISASASASRVVSTIWRAGGNGVLQLAPVGSCPPINASRFGRCALT